MITHTIRLGPPWEMSAAGGRVRHARRFGRPRTLGPGEEVWLVGDAPGPATVALNGDPVGPADGGFAVHVTDRLLPRNEVVIDAGDGPLGEVRLEIRGPSETGRPSAARLSGVRAAPSGNVT